MRILESLGQVSVTANGRPVVDLPPTFRFSLIGSIKDMWQGTSDQFRQTATMKLSVCCVSQLVATIYGMLTRCLGKVYGLAFLIICFSGVWPYLKPMLMLPVYDHVSM